MISQTAFKRRVFAYLRGNPLTNPTAFSKAATGDPHFVEDLRGGRSPRPTTRERVLAYIDSQIAVSAAQKPAQRGRATGRKPQRR